MDYSKQIFEMLGIKPNEEFKISEDDEARLFRIDSSLQVSSKNKQNGFYGCWSCYEMSLLPLLLNGTKTIIKIPKPTPDEQLAIDYARKCGYKWLAKNKDGTVYAYKNKPIKDTGCSFWEDININKWDINDEVLGILIQIPISFIHWEDDEPYYIGD